MKVRINVTKNDIEKGSSGSMVFCPIARAVKRALKPERGEIMVSRLYAYLPNGGGAVPLPPDATRFVDVFDGEREGTVSPFTFTLVLPIEVDHA
jgi:hypothetical protein